MITKLTSVKRPTKMYLKQEWHSKIYSKLQDTNKSNRINPSPPVNSDLTPYLTRTRAATKHYQSLFLPTFFVSLKTQDGPGSDRGTEREDGEGRRGYHTPCHTQEPNAQQGSRDGGSVAVSTQSAVSKRQSASTLVITKSTTAFRYWIVSCSTRNEKPQSLSLEQRTTVR